MTEPNKWVNQTAGSSVASIATSSVAAPLVPFGVMPNEMNEEQR